MVRLAVIAMVSLLWMGCAGKPVLGTKESDTYCKTRGVCEAHLRGKMMQYQYIGGATGGVVVGVMPAPSAAE